MKRSALCLLLVFGLTASLFSAAAAAPARFYDVPADSWAWAYVETLAGEDVISGYPDGTFRPDNPVTRAEFAKLLLLAAGLEAPFTYDRTYSDVNIAHWAYTYVEAAKAYLPGYGEGRTAVFRPDEGALREDIAYALVQVKGYDLSTVNTGILSRFSDVNTISAAVQPYMAAAVEAGYFGGYPDGTVQPRGTITRAEAAAVLVRAFRDGQTAVPQPQPEPEPTPEPTPAPEPVVTEEPAPEQTPPPDDFAWLMDEAKLAVGGVTYALGMTEQQLTERAGPAQEALSSIFGYNVYVFGADSYQGNFFLAGVSGGSVVMLCSVGGSFVYAGHGAGEYGVSGNNGYGAWLTDANEDGILHGALLIDPNYALGSDTSYMALYGEARIIFHLTNAFRVWHGLAALIWSPEVAEAARLHSQDMADRNYFQHSSPDGGTPRDRLAAQGLTYYTSAGENISGGYGGITVSGGIGSYNRWVNSSGHRTNLLGSYTYLGVGCGYNGGSTYRYYATQDFLSA